MTVSVSSETSPCTAPAYHSPGQKWDLTSEEVDFRRRVFWEVRQAINSGVAQLKPPQIHTEDVLQSLTQGRPRGLSSESHFVSLSAERLSHLGRNDRLPDSIRQSRSACGIPGSTM